MEQSVPLQESVHPEYVTVQLVEDAVECVLAVQPAAHEPGLGQSKSTEQQ
jgi:hypothetical protein